MAYSVYLPEGFTSWFAFYLEAKKILAQYRYEPESIQWVTAPSLHSVITTRPGPLAAKFEVQEYKYEVRHIEKQTLAELIELRDLETFTDKELSILMNALASLRSLSGPPVPEQEALMTKVRKLLIDERKKDMRKFRKKS